MSKRITMVGISIILDVNFNMLKRLRCKIPGFPKANGKIDKSLAFNKDEIIAFAKENNVGEILKQLDRARYADRKNNYQPRVKAQTDSQLVTQKLSLNNSNIARLF